jgi:DNA-directed RNA polymerase specialized sigma24 family protein
MKRQAKYKLADFETYIKHKAYSFAKRPADIDDFEQIGRIAAYSALEDDPTATKSYVYQRIDWRMIDFYQRNIYKNPEERSANEMFGNAIWGEYTMED